MFEAQYRTFIDQMDTVAERLRVLGVKAPESVEELIALSNRTKLTKADTADEMLSSQCCEFLDLIDTLRTAIQVVTVVDDDVTVGVFTEILDWSEKEHWMMLVSRK